MGFEYGYSQEAPETLVLWEAQFGDFVNSAQVIVDQFITSGLAKWGQTSRLTLLLPHGYEGSGPEHSSARLERFLTVAAEGNIRVASPTTPAQYFHLLRRQARIAKQRPLVVMTPKSLLRLPQATSTIADLAEGTQFRPVLAEPGVDNEQVTRLVLCTGKIYYDLVGHPERGSHPGLAVGRVELLYPFSEPARDPLGSGGAPQHGRARTHVPAADADHARGDPLRLHRPSRAREPRRGLSGCPHQRTEPDRENRDRSRQADLAVPAQDAGATLMGALWRRFRLVMAQRKRKKRLRG
jgi:hypothetical protein